MNDSTLYTDLVTFSPETPEYMLLTIAPFAAVWQNRHITSNISEYPGPILIYCTDLVDVLVGMITQYLFGSRPWDVAMATSYTWRMGANIARNDHYFSLQRSKKHWPIIVNPLSKY